PARPVQREHELSVQALTERVLERERFELADELRVAPERQIGIDALLEHRQPELLEARDLDLRERLVGEVGERRASPERQRLVQAVRIAACDELLESLEVELTRL